MTVWLAALLAGGFLTALEVRRPDRRYLLLRVAAVLASSAALAALLHPPSVPAAAGTETTALLATPGGDDTLVNRLRAEMPAVPVFRWPDSVADLDALRRRLPTLRHLHVAGWGLRESFWTGHDDLTVTLHPASPRGVVYRHIPEVVRLGDPAPITARIEGAAPPLAVWIEHPGGSRDTLPSEALRDSVIRFQVTPRVEGPASYLLGVGDFAVETLRVMVLPPKPPAVLVLEDAPSFETTFLRRWLADQGTAVATHTRLSRDQYRTERINIAAEALRPLTATGLERFDLLVIDGATLARLAPAERGALDRAVHDRGLGVLVSPDSVARREPRFFPFTLLSTGDLDERLVRPVWPDQQDGSTRFPVPALSEVIRPAMTIRPLMRDALGRIVAAAAPNGAGMVGTSLVTAPSRWLLEEAPTAYAGYWARLISALARPRADHWMLAADGPPAVDHGLSLAVVTADSLPAAVIVRPSGTVDSLGMAPDPAEPGRWWGRYWPIETGWHFATVRDAEPYPFYVDLMRDTPHEAAARLAATARRVGGASPDIPAPATPRRQPLPPLIPFLVLVLATGALWGVERRMAG